MAEISNPHDRFFREVFSYPEAAQDFVRYYLPPEVAATLDVPTLELSRESFLDPNLQEYISDLLYHVRLRDGSPAYVYVLLEHKSFPDRRTPFQLLGYFVRIQERSLRETGEMVPVILLVVYHGRSSWPVGFGMGSLYTGPEDLRRYWPDFAYHLVDLSRYSNDEIVGAATLQVALRLFKSVYTHDFAEQLPGIFRLLRDLIQTQSALEYLQVVLRYISQSSAEVTDAQFHDALREVFLDDGGATMQGKTLAQQWMEQGLEKGLLAGREEGLLEGREKGYLQGRREGLLTAIEMGLDLKFGSRGLALLPEIYRIDDSDVLRAVAESLRTAKSLDDLRMIFQAEA